MTRQEVIELHRMATASEARYQSRWYLLGEEGPTWHTVGGPYNTREAARVVKKKALDQWRALPWDVQWLYYESR